ncbi:hypothetical protein [Bradyrhizobium cosmicum]|uniref:Myb-like domain-containing protein n=1 Tax=Bradyrhizobium cosmicum TaxID=1404864 RepID=A0AAI8QD39_9BRAD|nr:hypothetical protein [Bradyrhizobium cosmicum]BAL77051.1 hypothetical protein S23_38560 [Bradyrhizobium cosmicum]
MIRAKKVRWTSADDEKLLRLRDGERLSFPEIVKQMPGRTQGACELRYYMGLKGVRDGTERPKGPKPFLPAVSWRKRGAVKAGVVLEPPVAVASLPVPVPPPVVERRRMPSLDHLRERAELQLRIDRQGLTAGFFGDPPPGRSALDQRRSGDG